MVNLEAIVGNLELSMHNCRLLTDSLLYKTKAEIDLTDRNMRKVESMLK